MNMLLESAEMEYVRVQRILCREKRIWADSELLELRPVTEWSERERREKEKVVAKQFVVAVEEVGHMPHLS